MAGTCDEAGCGFTDTAIEMEGVILSAAKNPEGDCSVYDAGIVAIFSPRMTIQICQSSYLYDATDPNRLRFDKFCKRNWLNLNGLLCQSIEQLAA